MAYKSKKTKDEDKTEDESKEKMKKADALMSEVHLHNQEAKQELETRITHKERGFDTYDKVYRNYIDKSKWPYKVFVPDGRPATLLKRKTDRLIASKLQGKLIPRRAGSELGARVGSELLLWQWTENDVRGDEPMLLKWRRMDLACRKYGASFGFASWNKELDIPTFEPLENRDVLLQPGARTIEQSEYVQLRRYVFPSELERLNKMSTTGDLYDPEAIKYLKEKKRTNTNYTSVNRWVIGLDGNATEKIEIITEYRRDKFITFCLMNNEAIPLRAHKNPYDHGQIPIVRLVYDVIDDDIYGVPELENVMPLIKANWALMCQALESAQNELYTPLMVNPKNVSVDTLVYKPGARWFMNTPGADVMPHQSPMNGLQKFKEHYSLLTSLILEGVGETAQDVSNFSQTMQDKTATEVKDLALLRSARDNANKLLLSQAISKMVYFWFKMDQQFITGHKLVHVVGKDAMQYLMEEGLNGYTLEQEGFNLVSQYSTENQIEFDQAYEILRSQGALEQFSKPLYPITIDKQELPKLQLDKNGKGGFLAITPDMIAGDYDFIPDVEAMSMPNDQSMLAARNMFFEASIKVSPELEKQGYRVKWKEMLEKLGDTARIQDTDQFFEQTPVQMSVAQNQPVQGQGPAMPGQPSPQVPVDSGMPQAFNQAPPMEQMQQPIQ